MSENEVGREPIEIVEIVLPKCINTYGVSPCTASIGGDRKCYNCRATCQDPENYRDTPDRHLTADVTKANGETIDSSELTRTADLFFGAEVRFSADPSGVIWELGGAGRGAYFGVTSGNLVFRAGDGSVASGANTGKITVDASQYAGKTLWLYAEIDFAALSSCAMKLWAFDPVELSLTLAGEDTWTDDGSNWSGAGGGAVGTANGAVPVGEDDTDWDGNIYGVYFYDSQTAPADMGDNYSQHLYLGRGIKGEPRGMYILSCLNQLSAVGSRININAADSNYEPLGRRATLDFSCDDFTHSDIGQDPYLSDRTGRPEDSGTFWRKWLVRQKFGRVGATVKVHDGYAGQAFSDYKTRSYVLDSVEYNEDSVSFHCRDVLSRTEFRKAQVPPASNGTLSADLNSTATSFSAVGNFTDEYPESGTVRINDEIMTYTSISYSDPDTTWSGVTRGTDGSEATDHDAEDLIQVCRRYTDEAIDDVLIPLFVDDARIPAQLVNVSGISDEVLEYLSAYNLTTLITEPTGVSELVGKLSEECSFYTWWDERAQLIDMKAIRAVGAADIAARWTNEDNIIANSLKLSDKPKQRLNVVTFYYNPLDWTKDLDKASNFKSGLKVVNGTSSLPEQYGNVLQTREIYSLWLTTEALANQTASRMSIRYADVPQFATFYVDAKDRSIWLGDVVTISHPMIVNEFGARSVRNWLIVEAEEVVPGHTVKYVAADITLDGNIYYITENTVTEYTEELFEAGNAFITDANGLNPDGTIGATIN